jgi:hypothetical protein
MNMNKDKLASIIHIEETSDSVSIKLGWKEIASIQLDEDGRWYPSILGKDVVSIGYLTSDMAYQAIVDWLEDK